LRRGYRGFTLSFKSYFTFHHFQGEKLPTLKEVFIATRPWSFVMTIMSILFGVLLARYYFPEISWGLSVLALVGSILLHAAVNVWNDYYDYKYGFDNPKAGTAIYRPHPLVLGFMTPGQVMGLATLSAVTGLAIGIAITFLGRPLALLLGSLGALLAFFYTGPPLKYKYRGFGELGVFLAWGPLMVLGAYYVASGVLSWRPVIDSIPLGLLVSAVLLANNIRDIEVDAENGAKTLAVRLGKNKSIKLYNVLIILPYVLIVLYVALKLMPLGSLLVFLSLPQVPSLIKMFERGAPPDADPRTAKLLQNFGLLLLIGVLINIII
jgi:1,4-dihydroxy-2-naphthoate octaprenyltransferase